MCMTGPASIDSSPQVKGLMSSKGRVEVLPEDILVKGLCKGRPHQRTVDVSGTGAMKQEVCEA